jgi:hypothetical protein
MHCALREPADALAERLLAQLHQAAVIGRLDELMMAPLYFGGGRCQNRLGEVGHCGER